MKKLLLTAGLLIGLNNLTQAQNSVTLKITDKICIESLEVVFNDKSSQALAAGCDGLYKFNVGKNAPEALIINGVLCEEGKTDFMIDGQKIYTALTKVVQVDQQKLDGILGLIR